MKDAQLEREKEIERAVLCHVTWAETTEICVRVKPTNHSAGGNLNVRFGQSASTGTVC